MCLFNKISQKNTQKTIKSEFNEITFISSHHSFRKIRLISKGREKICFYWFIEQEGIVLKAYSSIYYVVIQFLMSIFIELYDGDDFSVCLWVYHLEINDFLKSFLDF